MSLSAILAVLRQDRDAALFELQTVESRMNQLAAACTQTNAQRTAARRRCDQAVLGGRHGRVTAGQLQSQFAAVEACERRHQVAVVAHEAAALDLEAAQNARVEAEQKLRAVELLVQRRSEAEDSRCQAAEERYWRELLVSSPPNTPWNLSLGANS